jgi:hypothetical protein
MQLHEALAALDAGSMTRSEAADLMAWIINKNDVALQRRYHSIINDLITSGDLVQSGAIWKSKPAPSLGPAVAKNKGGRPRSTKIMRRVSFDIDADTLAQFDAIVARGVITRNAMIKMILKAHINKHSS